MLVTLIAALARDRVIGSTSGKIPWDFPRDRAFFRAYTAGKWLLLGRRTYGEMDGWFGDRTPLVLTRDPTFRPPSPAHRPVRSIPSAIDLARANGVRELVVCGGAGVYAGALPFADRLVLTRLELDVRLPGPVCFPDFEAGPAWRLLHREWWNRETGLPGARLEVHERLRQPSPGSRE